MHFTEAGLSTTYCGTRLHQFSPNGEHKIDFLDSLKRFPEENVWPQFTLPWKSPWRVLTIGSLKNIVESDLGVAVSDPQKLTNNDFVKLGHASWSWALLKDNSVVYSIQHEFIDYTAEMRWDYCLIDVNWNTKKSRCRLEYPEVALRETVLNSIIHKDYSSTQHLHYQRWQ